MKLLLIIASLILANLNSYSQKVDFLKLIFGKKENYEITEAFRWHKSPDTIHVLSFSDTWNTRRFKLTKESGSYSENGDPYLFYDILLDKLFPDNQKNYLLEQAKSSQHNKLTTKYRKLIFIESLNDLDSGFFFSLTEPVFSLDSLHMFIDMQVFFKKKDETSMPDSCFGSVIFMFYKDEKKWKLFNIRQHLIL